MPIHFSRERFNELRETYRKWWAGELRRPIVPIFTYGHETDPSRIDNAKGPALIFPNAWDFSITPREFVETHDAVLSDRRWHGDAFPIFPTTAFGPGTMAAFLGCTPVGAPSTVWFMPPRENIPLEELHFEFDGDNRYYRRVVDTFEAAVEKWQGSVIIGMVDMGGILDVLSSFRGAENLLIDLIENPEEVLRCISELQEMWFLYYDKLNAILAPSAQGYSQWFPLYGEKPGYILQSDFSYMISPAMFDTFVAPELSASADRLSNAVYHMDGIGQIPHLESLLAIDGIKGIQWVPGSGEPEKRCWDELLSKILASGKKLLSQARRPDGKPIDIAADPGQLFLGDAAWHVNNIDAAKAYADIYGIEVR